MIKEEIKCSFTTLPFKSSLSFEYLIAEIEGIASQKDHPLYQVAKDVQKELEKLPELKTTITDHRILEKNRDVINRLMTVSRKSMIRYPKCSITNR